MKGYSSFCLYKGINSCFADNNIIASFVKIEDLYLSIENNSNPKFDEWNDNTDVIVYLDNGEKYIASFFTYKNIERLTEEHRKSGEYLAGKYFWIEHMVLIEKCSREFIQQVVEHLINEGDFYDTFRKI